MDLEEALAQADTYSVDEEICTIDNDLRTITIPSGLQTVGVESDEDVRRLNFQMPKQYGEVDLSAFDVRVNYLNANKEGDVYVVTDKEVSGDHMTFSWLLGRNAMAYKGTIRFIVCLKKIDEDGIVQQEFNTTVAQLAVLEGLETMEKIIQENEDLIEVILKQLDDVSGAEAKRKQAEEDRTSAELERQRQEQERQESIVKAENTVNEAKTIMEEMDEHVSNLKKEINNLKKDFNELNSKSNTRILLNRTLTDANTTYEVNMSKYNRGMVFVLFNANKSIKQSSILYSFSRSSSLTSLVELVNKNLENSGYKIESVVLNQDTIAITTGIYGGSLAVIYIGV